MRDFGCSEGGAELEGRPNALIQGLAESLDVDSLFGDG